MPEVLRSYSTIDSFAELERRFETFQTDSPGVRIRSAAQQLGVTEAELLATSVGATVTPLRPEFRQIFEALPRLGDIMASTRNRWAVIEKHGRFGGVDLNDTMGVVIHEAIDLRVFLTRFASAFAVVNPNHRRGTLHSIQFFDHHGDSIHKVYVMPGDDLEGWRDVVDTFRAPTFEGLEIKAVEPIETHREISEERIAAFQDDWLAMTDTHEFFPLLRDHDLHRIQALELAPEGHAIRVPNDSVDRILRNAAAEEVPIMVFVGSRGLIEIHSGPVCRIAKTGDWLNVLDPEFNLHLMRDGIDQSWVVKKPTEDGIVTSLELFDANGETTAMFFGERKPGIPELEAWRGLIEVLPKPE